MASVVLQDIVKRFGEVTAVGGVSLEIADGELLVLVGPSGCGKSTVLRIVAGLEEVTSGRVLIDSRDVTGVEPKDRDIAMVFQNYALYPHMTVFDNLAFGLKLRHVPKKEIAAKIQAVAGMLGLASLLDRRPRALSGGQRQRVALGRAIVREPKVFLMDEPLSNLDAQLRAEMRAEIVELQQRLGVTTIYVTHDQVEAMTMGQRIVVLKDGLIQQVGTPSDVYLHPANTFVASFIGTPAMNFLPAILVTEGGKRWAIGEGFRLEMSGYGEDAPTSVTVGIRPESLSLLPGAEPDPAGGCLEGTVDFVQTTGAESFIYLKVGPSRIICRCEAGTEPERRSSVRAGVRDGSVYLFDARTGQAIRARGEGGH